jgi:hypothetical protein
MGNRGINIVLVIVTFAMLVLLAFRVSFENPSGSGCSGGEGSSCVLK